MSQWLAKTTKNKVSISDLWPSTTIPIPKLLYWFILGYVPANLGQLAKNNHKTFLSESQLLDNLIDLVQQTTRHILKNKKLNDAEHFTLKHQQQA